MISRLRKNDLPRLARTTVTPWIETLQRHPRRVAGTLGVLFLGSAVTAFGIAPMAPDAAALPVHMIEETVTFQTPTVPDLANPGSMTLFHSDKLRRDDTAQSLLQRLGVLDTEAQKFLRSDEQARKLFETRPGKMVSVETNEKQQLLRLTARWSPEDGNAFQRLVIERDDAGLHSRLESGELTAQSRLASGVIRSSLFAATDAADIPDNVAVQLAEIFSSDIDFRRDLREGDRFSLVYEMLEADGIALRTGRILSAQFVNNGRSHEVVWFNEGDSGGAYYGFDGQSTRKSFLGSPLAFTRVSSGYGMRFHPVSGKLKPHLGVDYAAPSGTPVRTIGDGVVSFAGVQRGYGNVIEITHRDQKSTLYGHLSRIDVRKGQHVEQGEQIGAVGSTGVSTGPHLHFEFRDQGVHQDPLQIARENENIPVSASARPRFESMAKAMRQQLDAASSMAQASAQ